MPRPIDADVLKAALCCARELIPCAGDWLKGTIAGLGAAIAVLDRIPAIDQWIPVTERVPMKEEYLAKAKDGEEYMVRLLIAYQSDTVGYAIGYYDGFKWLDERSMRRITDVIAWKPFFPLPEQPGVDLP